MLEEDSNAEFLRRFNINDFSIAKYEKNKLFPIIEIGEKIDVKKEELDIAMECKDLIVFNHKQNYVVYKTLILDKKITYLMLLSTSRPFNKKNVDLINFIANLVIDFLKFEAS